MSADLENTPGRTSKSEPNPLVEAHGNSYDFVAEHVARVKLIRAALITREENALLENIRDPERFLRLKSGVKEVLVGIFTALAEVDGITLTTIQRGELSLQADEIFAHFEEIRDQVEKTMRDQARANWAPADELMKNLENVIERATQNSEFSLPSGFEEEMRQAASTLHADVSWREEVIARMSEIVAVTGTEVHNLDEAYNTALRDIFPTPESYLANRKRSSDGVARYLETFADVLAGAEQEQLGVLIKVAGKELCRILDQLSEAGVAQTLQKVYGAN